MKNIILTLVMIFICTGVFAQEKVDSVKFVYCQLVDHVKKKFVSLDVAIEFGTNSPLKDHILYKDSSGNPLVFNTFIDGMNYMSDKGWQFVQAYTTIEMAGGSTTLHWILRKPQK